MYMIMELSVELVMMNDQVLGIVWYGRINVMIHSIRLREKLFVFVRCNGMEVQTLSQEERSPSTMIGLV